MTDHLTPFVISHYDVFETHILSRLNTPEIARARCPCGNEGAIPASFVGNLVCSQLNRTFRSLVPKYQDACESHERDEGRELPGEDEDAKAFQISLLLQTSVSIRKWLAPYAGHRCEMDISQCANVSMSRCSRCGEWNCCEECLANEPTAKEWRAHVESCVGRRGGAKMTSTKTTTTS